MTLTNLYIYEILLHTYKTKNLISTNSEFHYYNTRKCNLLRPEFPEKMIYKTSYIYIGIKLYNRLPESVKSVGSITSFKNTIKNYLIQNVFYTIDEYLST